MYKTYGVGIVGAQSVRTCANGARYARNPAKPGGRFCASLRAAEPAERPEKKSRNLLKSVIFCLHYPDCVVR